MPVDGHQEPFVVVVPELDELPPNDVVGDGADEPPVVEAAPVVVATALLSAASAAEVSAAAVDVGEEVGVPVAEPEDAVAPGPAAAAGFPFAAYAFARCTPKPPAARVEVRSTPAVHRRVLRRAALTGQAVGLVMTLLNKRGTGGVDGKKGETTVSDDRPATFTVPVSSLCSPGAWR